MYQKFLLKIMAQHLLNLQVLIYLIMKQLTYKIQASKIFELIKIIRETMQVFGNQINRNVNKFLQNP